MSSNPSMRRPCLGGAEQIRSQSEDATTDGRLPFSTAEGIRFRLANQAPSCACRHGKLHTEEKSVAPRVVEEPTPTAPAPPPAVRRCPRRSQASKRTTPPRPLRERFAGRLVDVEEADPRP